MSNIKANIQLLDNYIKKYEIKVDRKIIKQEKINIECSIGFAIINIIEEKEELIGEIEMEYKIKIIHEKEEIGKINTVVGALFKGNNIKKDNFIEMLKYNGAPTLSQIVRSYIITNTSLNGMPTVIIPMINFVEFFKETKNKKNI